MSEPSSPLWRYVPLGDFEPPPWPATETRGDIDKNQAAHWQGTLKVGFTVE